MADAWPVYTPPSRGGRSSPGVPPSHTAVVSTTWLLVVVFLASAIARFLWKRRLARGPTGILELVRERGADFVAVQLLLRSAQEGRERVPVARWNQAEQAYRTLSGVRARLLARVGEGELEVRVASEVRVEATVGSLGHSGSGEYLLASPDQTIWVLSRVAGPAAVEGPAFRGQAPAADSAPKLVPILDRFVVVSDRGGPYAAPSAVPGWAPKLAYPVLPAVALLLLAHSSSEGGLPWILGAVLVLGIAELLLWTMFVAPGHGR